MNASDWKKVETLVSAQGRPVATASSEELDSIPLSTLSLDEGGPPEIIQTAHVPLIASTPAKHQKNRGHSQTTKSESN